MANQKEQVREKIPIDPGCVDEATGGLIRLITLEYINRNRRWPRCKIREGSAVSDLFRDIVTAKSTIIDERINQTSLEDWASLEFLKNDDYDDIKDFTSLIDDKSCSLPRNKYHLAYSSYLTENLGVKLEGESRRLLTEILRNKEFDPVKIREIIQSRQIPLIWLIVGLCSKERELKVCGRLFTILAAPIRFFFGVTQKNVADKVMPYVSAQTMTLSDSQLVNRMYSNTNKNDRKTSFKITLSLDFEKFNQRWRREAVQGATRFLDEWFGTENVYSFVHDFFDHAFFYLCSQFEPPEHLRKAFLKCEHKTTVTIKDLFRETATTWAGQGGAGEGLFQKVWTMIVNGALHAVEVLTGIHSSIMGQGDNQVIVISWPIDHPDMDADHYSQNYGAEITRKLDIYTTELTRIMNGLGMKIKLEETWMSTKFLSYGKEPFFNGVYMSSTIKKLIRMYLEVNDVHPTAANRLGAVMSAGYSAASKDHTQVVPYLISIYEATKLMMDELDNGPINGDVPKKELLRHKVRPEPMTVLCCLLISKEFGGFPIIPFPEFLYRGHNDPVTSSLEWLWICSNHIPQLKSILYWISSRDGVNPDKDLARLILDPTCLNFRVAAQYSGQVASILERGLQSKVNNIQLKKLFNRSTDRYKDALFDYLNTVQPCFPRALNEIVRISPVGAMLAVVAQFQNIKTIKELLPFQEGVKLVHLIKTQDIKMIVGTVMMIQNILKNNKYVNPSDTLRKKFKDDWECRSNLAHTLRKDSWGKVVEGSTVPHPLEQFKLIFHENGICSEENPEHLVCTLLEIEDTERNASDIQELKRVFRRGPLAVYSGSTTREKKTIGIITFQKSDHGAKASARALHLKFWVTDPGSTLAHLLNSIAESRCNIAPLIMEGMIGEHYGGSATHRLHCIAVKYTQAPNTRPNFTTWGLLSSDPMGKYSRGLENYTILFQGAFLTMFAHLANRDVLQVQAPSEGQQTYHYHINCKRCCQPIYDAKLTTQHPAPKMPNVTDCIHRWILSWLSKIGLSNPRCTGSGPLVTQN